MSGEDAPRSRLARALVQYVRESVDHPYATIREVHRDGERDLVDLDLEIDLAQDRAVPILHREPVRIVFASPNDLVAPRVLSLRDDFPSGQVHTNLDHEVDGLCLCIWEEGWHDLSRNLTGQALVERIRWWFAGIADGSLHAEDQVLEPLIATTSDTIVFPPGNFVGPWFIDEAHERRGQVTLIMSRERKDAGDPRFDVFQRVLPSQVHGALASRPYDMGGLVELTARLDFDLMVELRAWLIEPERLAAASERRALFLLVVPKRRTDEGEDESHEAWVYTPSETLAELGEKLGMTSSYEDEGGLRTGAALPGTVQPADPRTIRLFSWRIVQRLDRATARQFAGSTRTEDARLVAIGAGAIGSNVIMNATHAGLGTWTIIDDDIVLPHNTVRQTQTNWAVGHLKAQVLAFEANAILAEGGNDLIVADVLRVGAETGRIVAAMREADLVVDFSASPAVVGNLADQDVRRASSFFFGPDGSDLVALDEGHGRTVLLDEIEAQYFLAVAACPALEGHLATARTDRIRYANACQDLSRPLPPWQVHMLSGLAAGRLPSLLEDAAPSAWVWRLDPDTGSVLPIRLDVQATSRFASDMLRVSVSGSVIDAMRTYRQKAAPNETGGILIGTFDLVRNVLHVVAALPAPPDSRQAPTYFVRGAQDLRPLVDDLASATAGRLRYVGEWHSHPNGAAARPSSDDEGVFTYLRQQLDPAGAPYAMLICGREETWLRTAWQDRGQVEGVVAHDND
ncbi:Mov34/MPN/PAD-1 family protein [Sphingomonas mucosissima]|uniref:Molybdopterin biosynthesis protein MoeB n=1 Tax=Sphingomonas mucosissima TaxID=370959 RepID=A0A245ZQI7_9SPHN|nr:Mov34/MPN/PAD-1 family protein [Sphingomonas mucosissima]OWK32012.1 molybdopterin biosynthesis protein MoeB [Sphingomonas mucosissima]